MTMKAQFQAVERGLAVTSLLALLLVAASGSAQAFREPPIPPAPPVPPAEAPGPSSQPVFPPPFTQPAQPFKFSRPQALPPSTALAWDAMSKDYTTKPGEVTTMFTFSVTNISKSVVYIEKLRPSCGCTVAKLPAEPWRLDPGSNGDVHITINFAGKIGLVTKFIGVEGFEEVKTDTAVQTNRLMQNLVIRVTIPQQAPQPPPVGITALANRGAMPMNRDQNVAMAKADRQAVFKGVCASCHAAPARDKTGEQLYQAVCAICHESSHRATMVPNLTVAKPNTTRDQIYWFSWIKFGKPGTLMPAFSDEPMFGGPLTPAQIKSLADYLAVKYPAQNLPLK